MRICFWNTNKNKEINPYIEEIMHENNVDVFVLAEYEADIEKLKSELYLYGIEVEACITIGCDRIKILNRKYYRK